MKCEKEWRGSGQKSRSLFADTTFGPVEQRLDVKVPDGVQNEQGSENYPTPGNRRRERLGHGFPVEFEHNQDLGDDGCDADPCLSAHSFAVRVVQVLETLSHGHGADEPHEKEAADAQEMRWGYPEDELQVEGAQLGS